MYRRFFKRICDLVLATTALLIVWPLMLVIALLIYFDDRGSVFFKQKRVGRNGREFVLVKFRSLTEGSRDVPSTEADLLRITRVGRLLRRTNLDEIPQLFSVVRGDMSIVGPRPALPVQTALCTIRQKNGSIHCLPGLTGLAQVNAYDGMPETEKAAFDAKYSHRISFIGDAVILLRTIRYLTRKPPVY